MKLELGCASSPTPGYIHHDRTLHEFADVAHDLNVLPWPWGSGECDAVLATDVMEHLNLEIAEWMDELWRICKPMATVSLRLPAWDNPLSYRDPTHRRVFHEETLRYWDPRHHLWQGFGRFYFDSGRWWHVLSAEREAGDIRYLLRKVP